MRDEVIECFGEGAVRYFYELCWIIRGLTSQKVMLSSSYKEEILCTLDFRMKLDSTSVKPCGLIFTYHILGAGIHCMRIHILSSTDLEDLIKRHSKNQELTIVVSEESAFTHGLAVQQP